MREMLFKGIAIGCVFFVSAFAKAENLEETKVKNVAYAISEQTYVELNNQYGEIQIITWEKDSFKLEASVIASTDKGREDLDKLMNMVEVITRGSATSVVVSTEWTSGNAIWKRGKMDLKNLLSSDKKLEVNYKVYLPANCRLTIENRFGDIYLPDFSGPLRITLAHGDFRAREIADARSIYVKYGKVLIKSVESGLLKVDFGSMILDRANNLTLQTKSSNIEVLEVNRLAIRSRNDDLRIDKVESLRGESNFSHIRIKEAAKLVDLTTNYGDVTIKEVKKNFDQIKLAGSNTDYEIDFSNDVLYKFNILISGSKGISLSHKEDIKSNDEVENGILYKGIHGGEEASSLVDIKAKNGYVSLFSP